MKSLALSEIEHPLGIGTTDLRQKSTRRPQLATRVQACAGEAGRARRGAFAVIPSAGFPILEVLTFPFDSVSCAVRTREELPSSFLASFSATRPSCAPEINPRSAEHI